MTTWTSAGKGKRFVITALGLEKSQIRGKYKNTRTSDSTRYDHKVPTSWVTNGYVMEVDE